MTTHWTIWLCPYRMAVIPIWCASLFRSAHHKYSSPGEGRERWVTYDHLGGVPQHGPQQPTSYSGVLGEGEHGKRDERSHRDEGGEVETKHHGGRRQPARARRHGDGRAGQQRLGPAGAVVGHGRRLAVRLA